MLLPISCRPPEFFIQLLLSSSDMDRDRQKDSKASSREAISRRQSYYECIFCKMGLSTAQALGGHMNIHRKDRTKRQQTPPVPPTFADEKSDEDPGRRRCFHPYAKRMASMEEDVGLGRPPKLDFSGEGLELSLSMHVYDLVDGGLEEKEEVVVEEAELDLELRLGH